MGAPSSYGGGATLLRSDVSGGGGGGSVGLMPMHPPMPIHAMPPPPPPQPHFQFMPFSGALPPPPGHPLAMPPHQYHPRPVLHSSSHNLPPIAQQNGGGHGDDSVNSGTPMGLGGYTQQYPEQHLQQQQQHHQQRDSPTQLSNREGRASEFEPELQEDPPILPTPPNPHVAAWLSAQQRVLQPPLPASSSSSSSSSSSPLQPSALPGSAPMARVYSPGLPTLPPQEQRYNGETMASKSSSNSLLDAYEQW